MDFCNTCFIKINLKIVPIPEGGCEQMWVKCQACTKWSIKGSFPYCHLYYGYKGKESGERPWGLDTCEILLTIFFPIAKRHWDEWAAGGLWGLPQVRRGPVPSPNRKAQHHLWVVLAGHIAPPWHRGCLGPTNEITSVPHCLLPSLCLMIASLFLLRDWE